MPEHKIQMQSEPKPPFPGEKQKSPGLERDLRPRPLYEAKKYRPAAKLAGKVALITGGDSGIGRAVAVLYAREGADVAFTYLPEEAPDAEETKGAIEAVGRRAFALAGDLGDGDFCRSVVSQTVAEFGRLDILVNNAAYQRRKTSLDELTYEEWRRTFAVNLDAYFHLVKAAVPHMAPGSAIIATSSETAFDGPEQLPDYSTTKAAINNFTKVLAKMLAEKGIRVNAVAPGPVWTPLNPADAGLPPEGVAKFGANNPYGRPAQPEEIAPAYVFLASDADASYISGIVLPQMGAEGYGAA